MNEEDISQYKQYIADSLPAIKELKNALGSKSHLLDFSPESLTIVDDWIKKNFQDYVQGSQFSKEETWWIVRFSYYIAEVVIRNMGAKWELDNAKNSFSFGRAVITLGKDFKVEPLGILVAHISNMRSIADWYKKIKAKYKPGA